MNIQPEVSGRARAWPWVSLAIASAVLAIAIPLWLISSRGVVTLEPNRHEAPGADFDYGPLGNFTTDNLTVNNTSTLTGSASIRNAGFPMAPDPFGPGTNMVAGYIANYTDASLPTYTSLLWKGADNQGTWLTGIDATGIPNGSRRCFYNQTESGIDSGTVVLKDETSPEATVGAFASLAANRIVTPGAYDYVAAPFATTCLTRGKDKAGNIRWLVDDTNGWLKKMIAQSWQLYPNMQVGRSVAMSGTFNDWKPVGDTVFAIGGQPCQDIAGGDCQFQDYTLILTYVAAGGATISGLYTDSPVIYPQNWGPVKIINNQGPGNLTISHLGPGSAVQNRVVCPGQMDLVLGVGDSAMLVSPYYNYGDTAQWRVLSTTMTTPVLPRVVGTTVAAARTSGNIQVIDTTSEATGVGGAVSFGGAYTGTTVTNAATIKLEKTNGVDGNFAFDLVFATLENGGGGLVEALRLFHDQSATFAGPLTADATHRVFDLAGTGLTSVTNTVSLNINAGVAQTCAAGNAVTTLSGTGITSCSPFLTTSNVSGTTNTTAKFTGTNTVGNAWPLDDATTWGVSSKFTITESTGAFASFGASAVTSAVGATLASGDPGNLKVVDTTSRATGVGGAITFWGAYTGTTTATGAIIKAMKSDNTDNVANFDLVFGTRLTNIGGVIEAFRLKSDQSALFAAAATVTGLATMTAGYASNANSNITSAVGTTLTSADPGNLKVRDTTSQAAGVGGGISFYGNFTGTSTAVGAIVKMMKTTATDNTADFDLVFGTRLTNVGGVKETFRMTSSGHLVSSQGVAPTGSNLSSCGGGSPALAAGSTDTAGKITEGTTSTGCTLTFATTYTNVPFCQCTSATAGVAVTCSSTATTLVVANASASGDVITYFCVGQAGST